MLDKERRKWWFYPTNLVVICHRVSFPTSFCCRPEPVLCGMGEDIGWLRVELDEMKSWRGSDCTGTFQEGRVERRWAYNGFLENVMSVGGNKGMGGCTLWQTDRQNTKEREGRDVRCLLVSKEEHKRKWRLNVSMDELSLNPAKYSSTVRIWWTLFL